MTNYLAQLNDQQRAAVEYLDGPELVIAGAGSGKTRVLTYKILHLLAKGFDSWRIMALTFTNKAATEMRERITQLVGEQTASRLWMGTFHSIFGRILRHNAERLGFNSNYTIYDSADTRSLLKMIIKDMELDEKIYTVTAVQNSISFAKNRLYTPEDYLADDELLQADRRAKKGEIGNIYKVYFHRCKTSNAMDFDDLLLYTYILFRDNPEILRHYREFFSYILVDEYQDTNYAQHKIVAQLAGESGRLCVVGDDAQSIYSFRGANIRNILEMDKTFKKVATFKLERNYRSTQNIIQAANSLIAHNENQIPKNVFSLGSKGEPVQLIGAYSDYEEGYLVAGKVAQIRAISGDSYNDFAILYRTNAQSRIIEEALRKRNIPYRIYGGVAFYQRQEVKNAVCYFRMAINPNDDEALKRVINVPARGIGETTVSKIAAAAIEAGVSLWEVLCNPAFYALKINKGTAAKLNAFRSLIESFICLVKDDNDAFTVGREIIDKSGIMAMYLTENTPENVSKQENLRELLSGLKSFADIKTEIEGEDSATMARFLAEVSLSSESETTDGEGEDRVTLMTIHAAKGLEFNNIFVVGVEEDLLPSLMSKDKPEQVEEERRLFYVALTRARNYCMVSFAKQRYINGKTTEPRPSRFLKDIDSRYLKIMNGTVITDSPSRRSTLADRMTTTRIPLSSARHTILNSAKTEYSNIQGATHHNMSELSVGMKITHPIFGPGTIMELTESDLGDAAIVEFARTDRKKLLLKYATFIISNEQ